MLCCVPQVISAQVGRAPGRRRTMATVNLLDVLAVGTVAYALVASLSADVLLRCEEAYAVLCVCAGVCTQMRDVFRRDEVWGRLCDTVWADKVFVTAAAKSLRASGCSRRGFKKAARDSERTHITHEELDALFWQTRAKAGIKSITPGWWPGRSRGRGSRFASVNFIFRTCLCRGFSALR